MVVILTAETGHEFVAPHERWTAVLELARRYGWAPQGTLRPGAWDGSYVRPCGQMIRSADAQRLAAALVNSLPDVPDHAALPIVADRAASHFETFSGARKKDLADLAEFLVCGACTIFGACGPHREGDVRLA